MPPSYSRSPPPFPPASSASGLPTKNPRQPSSTLPPPSVASGLPSRYSQKASPPVSPSLQSQWRFQDPIEDLIKANEFAASYPELFMDTPIDQEPTANDIARVRAHLRGTGRADATVNIRLVPDVTARPSAGVTRSRLHFTPPTAQVKPGPAGPGIRTSSGRASSDHLSQQTATAALKTSPAPRQSRRDSPDGPERPQSILDLDSLMSLKASYLANITASEARVKRETSEIEQQNAELAQIEGMISAWVSKDSGTEE